MDIAYCGACQHVGALHTDAGRGRCRLNGCPCSRFLGMPVLEPVIATDGPAALPAVSIETFAAIAVLIAFVAGFVIGKLL